MERLTLVRSPHPRAVCLGDAYYTRAQVEWRLLRLRRLDDLEVAVQLGRRRLVTAARDLLEPARPNHVEQAQRAERVDVACVPGQLERGCDWATGCRS